MIKITIIAMPGCGNLGDDLISKCLIEKIRNNFKDSEIGYISGEEFNPFEIRSKDVIKLYHPRLNSIKNWFVRKKKIADFIKTSDLLFIGGGGLLQDSHSPFTPYKYLKWIKYASCPVYLVGIGIGPIGNLFNKLIIKNILNLPGIHIQVRDKESSFLLREFGVKRKYTLGPDIVEGTDLNTNLISDLSSTHAGRKDKIILGCSLRPWKDLTIEKAVALINKVIKEYKVEQIYYFIFENGRRNLSEYEFAKQVSQRHQNIQYEIICYGKNKDFIKKYKAVSLAVASRYHANILWQKLRIPVIPIPYTDKVYSLYKKHGIRLHPISSEQFSYSTISINLTEKYKIENDKGNKIKLTLKARLLLWITGILSFFYHFINSLYIRL